MTGTLQIYQEESLVLDRKVNGRGQVQMFFSQECPTANDGLSCPEPLRLDFLSLIYDFESTAAVPEPSTVVLVVTGALGVWQQTRTRRRRERATRSIEKVSTSAGRLGCSSFPGSTRTRGH